ncbi:hypothetical protein F4808DRAFT_33598 [Astrocystis sublimbata]|nr:hypothetical protein F4808DRAFT_33598 [Astrocystis sublimbata]
MYWRTLIGNNTRREGYTITRETFDSFKRELGECAEMCLKSGVYRNSDTRSEVQGMANTKASQELELAIENVIMSDSQFMKFLGPFWICLQNRKLFTTDTGRFGFSSMHMEKGDVLCVFNGCHHRTCSTILERRRYKGMSSPWGGLCSWMYEW